MSNDVFRSVNDTTASAVKTGLIVSQGQKALCGGGTSCIMHAQELVLKNDLGLAILKKGGEVVDSFEVGKNLRDKAKALGSKIMDKKAKGRRKEYSEVAKDTYGNAANIILLPNDTQVSEVHMMFESLLHAKSLISLLC